MRIPVLLRSIPLAAAFGLAAMAAAQTPPLGPLAQVRSMGITLPVYTCGATPVPGGTCCPGLTSLDGFVASGGMALDPARHRLYAADFENNRVQVFDSQSLARVGLISALGSSGALNLPVDAALDADGNLYVADLGNEAVEKFDANLHYVASIAAGKGLSIVGVWAEGDSVYFSTLQNYVYRYTQGVSGYSASATFGEPGQLNHPNQIVKSGNWLYVTDTYNDRLVKFDVDHPGPVPTQVVGCLLIPTGLRPDATGEWLLEESDNGGYPAYVDTFSHDFSLLKSRCVFPDTWSAVQDPATGRTFVSGMNSLSVTVLQGCGPATPVPPTATPTLTPIPPPSPTATPVPGGARASTAARPNLSRNGQPIQFEVTLKQPALIRLSLYTLTGELAYRIETQGRAGPNTLTWTLTNGAGEGVASGVYLYTLETRGPGGNSFQRGKVLVLR